MQLNKEHLLNEYHEFRERARAEAARNRLEKSLQLLSYAALIAWQYPVLFHFSDDELERQLDGIAGKLLQADRPEPGPGIPGRVVLYAGQLIDSGALTEQYLHYFLENGYQVLVVVPSAENTRLGSKTVSLIASSPGAELFIPRSKRLTARIPEIHRRICAYNPQYCFLHFLPNDVTGYCVFSQIRNPKRYYIVHNDHTFWIGKGCADYFLEFRKFGYLLSRDRRRIPADRLRVLPFYPINNQVPFRGLPFDREGKIVGVSGAHLYKYLLDPGLRYFHTIKTLLREYPDFVFCLCGHGEGIERIRRIFSDGDVADRFFFLGRRDDFHALIGETDILFESYPLKGALTILYAIDQHKPFVGIANRSTGCIQEFFDLQNYREPEDFTEFLAEARQLIGDPDCRRRKAELFSGLEYNKSAFTAGLTRILTGNTAPQPYNEPLEIDDDAFLREYLMMPGAKASLLRSKLFILKQAIGIRERIACSMQLSGEQHHSPGLKEIMRILVLLILGR